MSSLSPLRGCVEVLSTVFALGWIELRDGQPGYVYAVLDGQVIGVGGANQSRPDLDEAGRARSFTARAFGILFNRSIPADQILAIAVHSVLTHEVIRRDTGLRIDPTPIRQIFVLGSPRSGTSALAATLAAELGLPWLGEGHAGSLFAEAADLLGGDSASPNDMVRFMAEQKFRDFAIDRARFAYYTIHASASFVDKTPGIAMIDAVPFLLECFPGAKFIYLRRNGISNVLSRMTKFGGVFYEHCEDWAGAMNRWTDVSLELPHFLEIEQEQMMEAPGDVAAELAAYLEVPEKAEAIAASLKTGKQELTGAGLTNATLADTNWTEEQIAIFTRLCGRTMERFGYVVDGVSS